MCSYVCPHAILRPMLLTEEEVKGAPEGMKDIPAKGKDVEPYRFHIAVSTLDCTGCGSCANVCPVGAMEMSTLDTVSYTHLDVYKRQNKDCCPSLNSTLLNCKG